LILGLHLIGHDPGFTVIEHGKIIDILELERINGDRFGLKWPLSGGKVVNFKKHIKTYIDKTSFFWENYSSKIQSVATPGLYRKKVYDKIHHQYIEYLIKYLNSKFKTNISTDISETGHHMSHAALACFTSPFNYSIIASIDGQGNDGYFNIYEQKNNELKQIKKYQLMLGQAYQANAKIINDQFGHPQAAPGKLMGLSSYGVYKKEYYKKARKFIIKFSTNKKFKKKFTNPRIKIKTKYNGVNDKNSQNWMNSFQSAWTDIILEILKKHVDPNTNLCLTGGCALNGITNYQIYNQITKNIYIPPNPGDCGAYCGAALYRFYVLEKNKYNPILFQTPFLGIPVTDQNELEKYNNRSDYKGKINIEELCTILRMKKIIGIIHGKSEIGPRALGNRSILCDCSSPEMRDIINNKVKFREWYRPFAPIVRKEDASKYFNFDGDSYYMSYVVPVREQFRDEIPAVCHIDGTARLQTVTKQSNSFLYCLLTKYAEKYKTGVLLNTSFNIKGQAILSSFKDAFFVLDNTELDGLYTNGHLWLKST
jgi:carbamoyltransferase